MVRLYETVFILKPDLEEEAREGIIERIKDLITSNQGEIVEVETWGNKKLAYEIKNYNNGFYTLISFKGNKVVLSELERNYRIIDEVIRSLIIKVED
ncbi:MAG: 30S ribosomal protein S6 [Halanaerobiaceae bacterium]|jgi:small subunit ribosomal protein S6|nr:30S ribosomal protein S6 [Halanaerobiaceae bacterium]